MTRKAQTSLMFLGACLLVCGWPTPGHAIPPNPTRQSPPPALARTARKVGTPAPSLALPDTKGKTWSLAAHLKHGPAVLVFYRGWW